MGSAGGARNSAVYNENAFLLSARSMVHCTRQPPPDFRPLMQVGNPHAQPPAVDAAAVIADIMCAGVLPDCRAISMGPPLDRRWLFRHCWMQGDWLRRQGREAVSMCGKRLLPMQEHFVQRRQTILQACDAYAAGACPIGHAGPDAGTAVAAAERRQQEAAAHASTGGAAAGGGGGGGGSSSSGPRHGEPAANGGSAAATPPAGSSGGSASVSGGGGPVAATSAATSEGFRLVLAQLRPRLAAALDSVSAT